MQNTYHFKELVPIALRSIPYILQSHLCKGYLALEKIHAQRPHLPDEIWQYCVSVIREGEPKVSGLMIEELLDVDAFIDPTSGRNFGPDWILSRGLMPLSYWAMRKKYHEIGFPALLQTYLEKALDHPIYLGHEISILAAYWLFYEDVLSTDNAPENTDFFIQRFTEFITTTFDGRNDDVFEHPEIDTPLAESEILKEALTNPGFFGHNVLAFVWSQRIKAIMSPEQYVSSLYNLTVMNRWQTDAKPPTLVTPCEEEWSDETLEKRLLPFFLEGPTNIHQITLADALLWAWEHFPEHRQLCAANILCFTRGARPQ